MGKDMKEVRASHTFVGTSVLNRGASQRPWGEPGVGLKEQPTGRCGWSRARSGEWEAWCLGRAWQTFGHYEPMAFTLKRWRMLEGFEQRMT